MASLATLAERFQEVELRLDKVVSLGCHSDFQALSDDAEAMLEHFDQVQRDTGNDFRIANLDQYEDENADLADALYRRGYSGVFAQFCAPVYELRGGHLCSSWGCYHLRWFYADTLEQTIQAAILWAENERKRAKPKTQRANGGSSKGPTPSGERQQQKNSTEEK